tara:strand:+ start:198 stop:428 length:231 start_codon:yes stop_codon:yes gene_type:complete
LRGQCNFGLHNKSASLDNIYPDCVSEYRLRSEERKQIFDSLFLHNSIGMSKEADTKQTHLQKTSSFPYHRSKNSAG